MHRYTFPATPGQLTLPVVIPTASRDHLRCFELADRQSASSRRALREDASGGRGVSRGTGISVYQRWGSPVSFVKLDGAGW